MYVCLSILNVTTFSLISCSIVLVIKQGKQNFFFPCTCFIYFCHDPSYLFSKVNKLKFFLSFFKYFFCALSCHCPSLHSLKYCYGLLQIVAVSPLQSFGITVFLFLLHYSPLCSLCRLISLLLFFFCTGPLSRGL